MKRNSFGAALVAAILAAVISFSTMQTFAAGLALPIQMPWLLYAVCGGASVLGAFVFSRKWGPLLALGTAATAAVLLWFQGAFLDQLLHLIYRITYLYNHVFHWGYLQLVEGPWNAGTADLPVAVWGGLLAAALGAALAAGGGMLLPGVLTLLPLGGCLLLPGNIAREWTSFGVVLGWCLVWLTGQVRKQSPHQAARLTLYAAPPMALALGLLFLLLPQGNYTLPAAKLRMAFLSMLPRRAVFVTLPEVQLPPQFPTAAAAVLAVLSVWLLLEAQRALRRRIRRSRQELGRTNAQAIALWQEVRLLTQALGESAPVELEILTGKAKFSRQPMAPEELIPYTVYLQRSRKRLREGRLLSRLYNRYILAVL